MPDGYGAAFRTPYSVELGDDEDRHVEELIALTAITGLVELLLMRQSNAAWSDRDAAA